jgi:NADPH-dependent glutamate synthase beta subunit-like oxidoreductase
MFQEIFQSLFVMGMLGILIGICLALASKIFYVYVDPKVEAIDEVLPGANCGGCGYPGCSANAEAVVKGEASPASCVAGGPELVQEIADILGVTVEAKEPDIARPGCTYGLAEADLKYRYDGMNDCRAAALLGGGMKVCEIGCMGLGSCMRACPFDAINMGPDDLPVVDPVRCTGCGTCERVCPKNIIKLSSTTRRILHEYTTADCITPCQRACPAGINIYEYIRQIQSGNYTRSLQVIKERNPFPTVIGRICPRPCESVCRRQYVDEPVAINYLKRFVADDEMQRGERVLPVKAPDTGRKIAVIGGGVEGLSAAYFAARLGHEPSVFEASESAGGLLRTAVSRYRLPPAVLDWDIEGIMEMGVRIRTEKTMGSDFTIRSLFEQDFDAVYLSVGGWDSRLVRRGSRPVESPVPGVHLLVDLMKFEDPESVPFSCGTETVIIGGGGLIPEAVSRCRALGAKNVTVLLSDDDPDPPDSVKCRVLRGGAGHRLFGEDNRLTKMEWTGHGNEPPVTLPVQTLLLSAGRFPRLLFLRETDDDLLSGEPIRWTAQEAFKAPSDEDTSGFFTGDSLSDHPAAIVAIGSGRRGAVSLHLAVNGLPLDHPVNAVTPRTKLQNVDDVQHVTENPRNPMPQCDPLKLPECGMLELGFTEETALNEAKRCLQCGLICYERTALFEQTAEGEDDSVVSA